MNVGVAESLPVVIREQNKNFIVMEKEKKSGLSWKPGAWKGAILEETETN